MGGSGRGNEGPLNWQTLRRRGGDGKNVFVSNEPTVEDKQARGLSFSSVVAPFIWWLNTGRRREEVKRV